MDITVTVRTGVILLGYFFFNFYRKGKIKQKSKINVTNGKQQAGMTRNDTMQLFST